MKNVSISLQGVSLKFRNYQGSSGGLKESVLRTIVPPGWARTLPPRKEEFWALRDIDLELRQGDRLGIIGHNGAGKSSLLRIISRIYRATSGTVRVEGRVVPLIELGAGFNPELTGRENAFLNAAILGIGRKLLLPRIPAIQEFSELGDHFDVPVKYYSTGMLLRLAFSVATEVTPDILILDELFAGADAAFVAKANKRLDEFVDRTPIFILVSHELHYMQRFCNRVVMLEKGRLVDSGTPAEMVPRYLERALGAPSPSATSSFREALDGPPPA